jgi:dynein heavy chain
MHNRLMYVPGELGTKTAQGTYRNEVQVLDTGTMVWNAPNVEGDEAPHPRSDSDLVYDAKGSRIFLFGGWANRWFDDLYILDVGSVVGPPYAIMGIKPKIGPITGGQEISIEGLDFVRSNYVVIRFSSRAKGGQMEVAGEFVSSTLVKCISPDFMDIGSGEVEVRVSLNGDSYTTTYQKYNFFAVTDAEKCICFGPGIISGGAPQVETVFVIQAVDATGIFRETGGDVFDIVVRSSATAATVREVLMMHVGGTRWWYSLVVLVGGTRCVTSRQHYEHACSDSL